MSWKLVLVLVAGVLFYTGCGNSSDSEIAHSTSTEGQDETTTSGNDGFEFNGLYWQVGPDRDMTWDEANEWVESLGAGWRMPTRTELQGLWDAGVSSDNWGPFANSGFGVWSGEAQDSMSAWCFIFFGGLECCENRSSSGDGRAFAVRSR